METMRQTKPDFTLAPNLVTIVREISADLETPVSVYLKLAGSGPSFLLESVTGGEQLARYSFIGVDPTRAYVLRGRDLEENTYCCSERSATHTELPPDQDPWDALRAMFSVYHARPEPGLPRFVGGLVGYVGYEMMRYYEPSVRLSPHPHLPDAIFLLTDILVAFDHAFGRLLLIGNASMDDRAGPTVDEINARLDQIEQKLSAPAPGIDSMHLDKPAAQPRSNMTREEFVQAVETAKEYIAAGDIFQVVLSQRFDRKSNADPFRVYRSLRRLNPSPYMFYFDFGELAGEEPLRLIGTSPEMHARLEGSVAAVRPIAGTRVRGKTPEEEAALEKELLEDPKERAEHVMLVDLGRNDLGRICEYGSVRLKEQMIVERYSHVVHIASHVEGELRPEYDAFDLLRATFPAGTVSGAPKIRAMQIINELEPDHRGPYAGAVGYFSYDGSMDTCIAIRTMVQRGDTISLQAGAGIVADSVPGNEYQETLNKLGALAVAIDMAEELERAA